MTLFLQQIVNGVTQGAMYALVALGYSLVYGLLQLFNFAHGELFMVGAYLGIATLALMGFATLPPLLVGVLALAAAVLGGALGSSALGLAVERFAYRPVERAPRLAQLISVLGSSILIQNAVMLVAGKRQLFFPQILPQTVYNVGGVAISSVQILIMAVAACTLLGLYWFANRTVMGMSIRATAQNPTAAALVGIDPRQAAVVTFALGSALGAVGGVLFSFQYGVAFYNMGFVVGLRAFAATVIGGIGSIGGAVLGGLLLGIMEAVGAGLLPVLTRGAMGPEYRDLFTFLLLVLMLIFRPSGLLGVRD